MEKKYILTDETITLDSGVVLHRIKAIRSFKWVNVGDLGGWVEKEDNLSHNGDCWIFGNARVYDNAIVFENAIIYGNATICDNACVYDNTIVRDNAIVCDNARLYYNANVYGNARVFGDTKVSGNTRICDNAIVYGNVEIDGNAEIRGNAVIQSINDYIVFKNWWSSGRYFTWTRSNNMWRVGCFYGTGKELIKKAYKDSKISGRRYEQIVKFVKKMLLREKITNFFQKLLCISEK